MDKFGQRALAAWKQSRAGATAMAGGRARVRVVWSGREWHGCKDRWTKRGGELGLFQISKTR